MIHVSCVSLAWVDLAMSGNATFSDDIAATTAASAMHTTAVTARWFTSPAAGLAATETGAGLVGVRRDMIVILCVGVIFG